jgi:signal transduction histidine kinase
VIGRWAKQSERRPSVRGRAVEDLLRSLALIVEPRTLRASIAGRVRELVGCRAVVVCDHDLTDDAYKPVCSTALGERLPDASFSATGTLCRWLRANQDPFVVDHPSGLFQYLDDWEQSCLTGLGARVCVPVFAGARLVAVLLLCSTDAEWHLRQDDADLLAHLGMQAGLALENAALHQLERERLQGAHQAEQLALAGQLAASLAHEIRNPLTAIRSTVQFVLQSASPWEQKRELLEDVIDEVDRIENTVGGLLTLSRGPSVELGEADLVQSAAQALSLVEAYAEEHSVIVDRQFEIDVLPITGDSRALHQVCVNLFLNACQAMPRGGRLTVRCTAWNPSSETRPLALMQVRDTGTGFSPEHLSKAFDPFFTTKRTGTGLGLPICLEIVSKHEGTLRLESEEGRGTLATVMLPLRM